MKRKRPAVFASPATGSEFCCEQLLQETEQKLQDALTAALAQYDAKDSPLGIQECRQILFSLKEICLAQRLLLPVRMAENLQTSDVFLAWNQELAEVEQLSVQACCALRDYQAAIKKARYSRAVAERVKSKAYLLSVQPEESELAPVREGDAWQVIAQNMPESEEGSL